MDSHLNVGLAQYLNDRDPAIIVGEAKNAVAEIVLFPEMFSHGHACFDTRDSTARERWLKAAQSPNGSFVERCREAARTYQTYVVATFLEAADPKPFNSALLIGRNVNTILRHRKVCICDFDSPEIACGRGKEFSVAEIETAVGSVKPGLMICMDVSIQRPQDRSPAPAPKLPWCRIAVLLSRMTLWAMFESPKRVAEHLRRSSLSPWRIILHRAVTAIPLLSTQRVR